MLSQQVQEDQHACKTVQMPVKDVLYKEAIADTESVHLIAEMTR